MRIISVVAAIIVKDGKVFAMQRGYGASIRPPGGSLGSSLARSIVLTRATTFLGKVRYKRWKRLFGQTEMSISRSD